MFWIRVINFVSIILLVGMPLKALVAEESAILEKVVVEGNQRIETDTIRSYLLIQEGDLFSRRRIDQSLKSLYATGYFADLSIKLKDKTLVVKVIENPVINRIAFEGNLRIEDEILKNEVSLKPRVVFNRPKVQKDVEKLLNVYRVNGRYAATVDPKVILLPQNRANLVFEIDEGPLTKVDSIRFIGNKTFDDSDLKSIISTKEDRWYRFFTSSDTYDPDRLKVDRELLREYYLAEGYADFRIESAIAELTPDRGAFYITLNLNEGERYKFGEINISSGIRNVEVEQLKPLIEFKKGDWYDKTLISKAIKNITDEVGTHGYAFVQVRPQVKKVQESKEINLNLVVREGPRVFVERIDIGGNVRTVDSVIRREIRLVEGDAFDAAKLRKSRQRISDLNFFDNVKIKREPGSARDKAVIKIDVEEKSTGSLNFGVGYGTDAGPLVDVTLRERNLLGLGQHLSVATTLAAEKSSVNLSFTEPYFLDREVSAGFDLFHVRRDFQDTRSYDTQNTGFAMRSGYPLNQLLSQNWKYGLDYSEIANVGTLASPLIKQQEGTRTTSAVTHGLLYDTRDSKFNPTEGFVSRLSNQLAGIGGDVYYLKNTVSGAQYYSFAKDWILTGSGRVGYIVGLGEDVEITDRFFLGGDSLRGFATAGVGPRDRNTRDSLGGEWLYNGTIQLIMPLGLPDELAMNGRIFSDFGSLGGVNPSNSSVFDSASLRASLGAGIGWVSPFGPINVDVGFPILKESLDEKESLRVNFGTRF